MKNDKTLKGISVADLLLQIQDAQNKIQEAQNQISETLEAIKALQAQEPESQEIQEAEQVRAPEVSELEKWEAYNARIEEAERKGYEALSAFEGLPERLERLENECFSFGCYVAYDEGNLANHIRQLYTGFNQMISRMEENLRLGEFDKLDERLKRVETEGWRNIISIDDNLEFAKPKIEEGEGALKEIKAQYDKRGKAYPPITNHVQRLRKWKE